MFMPEKNVKWLSCTVLLTLLLSACVTSQPPRDVLTEMLTDRSFLFFEATLLTTAPDVRISGESQRDHIYLWHQVDRSLGVAGLGDLPPAVAKRARLKLHRFQKFSNLPFHAVDDHDKAGISFVLSPLDSIRRLNGGWENCRTELQVRDGQLIKAIIHLPAGEDDLAHGCILRQLMHAYGFTGESGLAESVLSPAHAQTGKLRFHDERVLTWIYGDKLAGLHALEVLPALRDKVARDFRRKNPVSWYYLGKSIAYFEKRTQPAGEAFLLADREADRVFTGVELLEEGATHRAFYRNWGGPAGKGDLRHDVVLSETGTLGESVRLVANLDVPGPARLREIEAAGGSVLMQNERASPAAPGDPAFMVITEGGRSCLTFNQSRLLAGQGDRVVADAGEFCRAGNRAISREEALAVIDYVSKRANY
jgi:hypothetical protein